MRNRSVSRKKLKTNYNRVLRRKDRQNLRNASDDFTCLTGKEIRKHYDTWNIEW